MKKLFIILFILLNCSVNAHAQDTLKTIKHDNHYLWLHFGMGKSATKELNYTNASGGITYMFKNTIAIQFNEQALFKIFHSKHTIDAYQNKIFALGINKSFEKKHSLMLFGGLSRGKYLYLGEYIKQKPPSATPTTPYSFNINMDITPSKASDYEQTWYKYHGLYLSFQHMFRGKHLGFSTLYYIHFQKKKDHGLTFIFNLGHLNK